MNFNALVIDRGNCQSGFAHPRHRIKDRFRGSVIIDHSPSVHGECAVEHPEGDSARELHVAAEKLHVPQDDFAVCFRIEAEELPDVVFISEFRRVEAVLIEKTEHFIVALTFQNAVVGQDRVRDAVHILCCKIARPGTLFIGRNAVDLIPERRNRAEFVKFTVGTELSGVAFVTGAESVIIDFRALRRGVSDEPAGGYVDGFRQDLGKNPGKIFVEKTPAVVMRLRTERASVLSAVGAMVIIGFVGTAPDGDGGMMRKTRDHLPRFFAALFAEDRVEFGDLRSAEHEILPD